MLIFGLLLGLFLNMLKIMQKYDKMCYTLYIEYELLVHLERRIFYVK